MKCEELSLRRVAWSDRRFSFSRPGDTSALEKSIGKVGLIDPPDLLRCGGRCVIIRGRRRLLALRRLGRRTLPANLYDEEEISPFDAWSMNFNDTRSRRELNPAEACTAVRQLADLGLAEPSIAGYLSLLGLPRKPGGIGEYLAVAKLETAILDALSLAAITLPTASFLATLDGRDRRAAFGFLKRRPLTVSRQREWVRLVGDIAARDAVGVAPLLASVARSAARRPGPPGAAALQILRERRYPALAERRREFRALVRRLKLPPSLRIETHPFFERDELSASITARDPVSWRRAIALLAKSGDDAGLMKIIGGERKKKGRR